MVALPHGRSLPFTSLLADSEGCAETMLTTIRHPGSHTGTLLRPEHEENSCDVTTSGETVHAAPRARVPSLEEPRGSTWWRHPGIRRAPGPRSEERRVGR